VEALALGDYASRNPLRPIARMDADANATGPAFGLAVSERELWLAAARSAKYELDPERGQLSLRAGLAQPGPAVAPLQLGGGRLVAAFQDRETGGVSLMGVDPGSGAIAWQTVLGASWPSLPEAGEGGKGLASLGRNGKALAVAGETLAAGGFATLDLPRPGELRMPAGRPLRLEQRGRTVSVLAPREGPGRVWVEAADQPGGWRSVELPAALAAPPLPWDGGLLIPGADARVYLVDPISARSLAEPFVPVFSRERQGRWLAPSRLGSGAVVLADDAGRVRLLSHPETPVSRLVVEVEKLLDKRIIADPIATPAAVLVVTEGPQVRALSVRDLSAVGSWPLEAPPAEAPVRAGERVFVYDVGGGVGAFGRDGRRLWQARLDAPATGPPIVRDDLVWLLDRAGRLHGRALADGSPRRTVDLGIAPAGGMIEAAGTLLVPTARGTLQPFSLDAATEEGR
jgi:hypothetical protein